MQLCVGVTAQSKTTGEVAAIVTGAVARVQVCVGVTGCPGAIACYCTRASMSSRTAWLEEIARTMCCVHVGARGRLVIRSVIAMKRLLTSLILCKSP